MKISDKAKQLITTRAKNKIAIELNCSAYTVDRWLKDNESNGDLTKAVPLRIIREETGLTDEQILEEAPVVVGEQR